MAKIRLTLSCWEYDRTATLSSLSIANQGLKGPKILWAKGLGSRNTKSRRLFGFGVFCNMSTGSHQKK